MIIVYWMYADTDFPGESYLGQLHGGTDIDAVLNEALPTDCVWMVPGTWEA